MQVTQIWRYPVKSLQGESLAEARIEEHGVVGDRAWALFDPETGTHLTARRQPELLFAGAKVIGDGADIDVVIVLPDGTETNDDAALSAWLGRPVELRAADGDAAGTFETQADETETGKWYQWTGPAGSFHDSTVSKISLVSPGWFRDWDPRRFRINVVLDGPGDVELVGQSIQVGEAGATVHKRIDRCVMTTRPQPALGDSPALERDLEVLKTITREDETFLGVGALIDRPGVVRIGDEIRVTDAGNG